MNTSAWQDPRYQEATRHVQDGAWKAALEKLHELQQEYPDQAEIQDLIESAQIKVGLDQKPVSGLSPLMVVILHRRRLTLGAVTLLVLLVLVGGWLSYQRWVEPAQQARRQQAMLVQTLSLAQRQLGEAAYADAILSFERALHMEPQNEQALGGLGEAQHQLAMTEDYREAVNRMEAGDLAHALAIFQTLRDQDATYRDVPERIAQILQTLEIQEIFVEAEQAYLRGQWADAILLYNLIRQQQISYRSVTVDQHLFDSYIGLAGQKMKTANLNKIELEQTADLYRRGLGLRPRDPLAQSQLGTLNQYQQAQDLMNQKRYNESAPLLATLYANDPSFLGGDARAALFQSRMGYGEQLEGAGNLFAALTQYNAAASLPVEGALQARLRARSIELALMPTPTPTPTLTPTPTPDPLDAIFKMIEPTPAPMDQFVGWIAFQSDRPGSRSGFWVMRPDGSDQQPVVDPTGLYDHLRQQVTWTPDNQRRIWVEDDGSGASVAIYMWRYDVPPHWLEARVELLNNSGINYQPAFAPDGQSIVFTSQRGAGPTDGNWGLWGDEIFLIRFADYNPGGYVQPIRLTHNDWEWDKHPTFSPDGQTIAFWSNRISGRAQIWAMTVDGANQRNLSNNEWNDWDPLWIVPKREVPQLNDGKDRAPLFDPAKYTNQE
jgi:hypothetical protein